jgi:hypothetical protein
MKYTKVNFGFDPCPWSQETWCRGRCTNSLVFDRVRFQNGFLEVRGCKGDQINLSKKMWMKIKAPIMLKASNLVTEVKEEKLAMIQDYVRVLKLTETYCT